MSPRGEGGRVARRVNAGTRCGLNSSNIHQNVSIRRRSSLPRPPGPRSTTRRSPFATRRGSTAPTAVSAQDRPAGERRGRGHGSPVASRSRVPPPHSPTHALPSAREACPVRARRRCIASALDGVLHVLDPGLVRALTVALAAALSRHATRTVLVHSGPSVNGLVWARANA